ncbi:DUF6520 family protein [Flavivirga jejuensis]|uniref:DUF6520 family protein n=1 Tax=Flavivirga jejuensis TaxID=870487 RepID=A0ABT8WTM5_9FLAO|nr:DUF6520 family protein [Flavivirga jejuensis]MDO5976521.1 DUF6520 family protein [Flavivirga jejuensis]
MKHRSLKTVLYAFVFTLAIGASFAFKSAPSDPGIFIQKVGPTHCESQLMALPYGCSIDNWGAKCAIIELGVSHNLYSRVWGVLCMDQYRLPL